MGRLAHHTGEGWTYFVTTKAWQSTFLFRVEETARIIVAKILEYRNVGNYLLHGFVLMPNHLHLIQFEMDPIPQGLKPLISAQVYVGAKAQTLGAIAKFKAKLRLDADAKDRA